MRVCVATRPDGTVEGVFTDRDEAMAAFGVGDWWHVEAGTWRVEQRDQWGRLERTIEEIPVGSVRFAR